MPDRFQRIENLISALPSVCEPVSAGTHDNGFWWVKFAIDIHHPLAWKVVKQLAHVINYLSISERFSTVFYPIEPPRANVEATDSLSWIIETTSEDFSPAELAEWLESRMPDSLTF